MARIFQSLIFGTDLELHRMFGAHVLRIDRGFLVAQFLTIEIENNRYFHESVEVR